MEFLYYNFEVAICMAVLYVIYFVFVRNTTFHRLNRAILLLCVGAAFIFPALEFQTDATIDNEIVILRLQDEAPKGASEIPIPKPETFTKTGGLKNLRNLLWYSYFLFIGLMLLKYLYSNIKILNILRKSHISTINGYSVHLTDKDISPFTYFNKIVIPRSVYESDNIEYVVAHEAIHAKEWHNIDLHLIQILKSMQILNPFIYLFERDLKSTHEYIADAEAVVKVRSKAEYMQTLLDITVGANVASLANSFNGIKLIRRLKMLDKSPSNSKSITKYLALVPVLAALFFVFSCNTHEPFKQRNHSKYLSPDSIARIKVKNFDEEIRKRLTLPEDWKNGTKTAKFSVSYEIDTNGRIGQPYMSNAKFADSKLWSNSSIDKNIESQLIAAVKDIDPLYTPAIKDGKKIISESGMMLIIGDEQKWLDYNASGTVSVKLPYADYRVGYTNPSEDAGFAKMGLPVLSNAQCYRLPKLLNYPDAARKAEAIGEVELSFEVDADGRAKDIKVEKSMGYGCDESAKEALSKLNGFRPNQKFNSKKRLPLTIRFAYGAKASYKEIHNR